MTYILTGFSHTAGLRVFNFEGIAEDRTRSRHSVSANVDLSRKHGIRIQELPFLCLRFLGQLKEAEGEHHLTFTETDMLRHADLCATEKQAAKKRQAPPKRNPLRYAYQDRFNAPPEVQ